jgi:hypothetical protein
MNPTPSDDGSLDGLAAFRRAFGDSESGAQAPTPPPEHTPEHKHWRAVTLLAIDEFTQPGLWCPNGHITAWVVKKGTPEEAWVHIVALYPRAVLLQHNDQRDPTFRPISICLVCGEEGHAKED